MKLLVIAVGQRVPDWAQTAWADYAKRFPPELRLELKAIKTEPRSGGKTTEQIMTAERQRIEAAIPSGTHVVALDERGSALTTAALAAKLSQWQGQGGDVALLIGGPDGLQPYRDLAPEIARVLRPEGVFAVEIGWDQGEAVKALFEAAGFADVKVVKDLGDRDRVVTNGPDPRTNPIPQD